MKYLCLNDFLYLIRKKCLMLMLVFMVPLFIILFRTNIDLEFIDIVMFATGTNLKYSGALEVILFLFNCFTFIYLIFYLYTKDLTSQLENIFLRMSPNKYILIKNLLCTATIVIIKIVEYLIIFLFVSRKVVIFEYLRLVFSDITYIIFIKNLCVLFYLIFLILKKNIFIVLPILVLVSILIPKNIVSISNYLVIVIVLIAILYFIIYLIFIKNVKRIFENL